MKNASELDIVWLAGLLEGEGCFTPDTNCGKYKRRSPRVKLKMTDRDVVERAAALMDVECRPVKDPSHLALVRTGKAKQAFSASATGDRGRAVMRAVLQYMGKRRTEKILESLEDWT